MDWVGSPYDFSITSVTIGLRFGTALGLDLRGLDLGLGLESGSQHNKSHLINLLTIIDVDLNVLHFDVTSTDDVGREGLDVTAVHHWPSLHHHLAALLFPRCCDHLDIKEVTKLFFHQGKFLG